MDHGDENHLYLSPLKTFDTRLQDHDIYKGDSTYQEDYQFYVPEKRRIYKWSKDREELTKKITNKAVKHIDQESYTLMKPDVHVPFNLLWKPKPIVGTYPKMKFVKNKDEILQRHLKTTEKNRSEATNSRPNKTNLSPAVQMDDIEDTAARSLITSNMYESEWKRATRLAANAHFKEKTPYPDCDHLFRPSLHFKSDKNQLIEGRFRRRGRNWDEQQAREVVDPTAKFWLNKELTEADIFATEKLVTEDTKREIKKLMRDDKLRIPHDLPMPDYAGYQPKVPYGVALRKIELPVTHPNISVTQAITVRYAEDELIRRKQQWKKSELS